MRSFLLTVALFAAATFPVHAQHLQDRLSALFIFGDGQDQLFLGGTADPNNPDAIRIHGSHFVPSAVASNGTVISFLTNSIGSNVANIPVAAASGGSTFSFEGGMPVRTSSSAGPVFGERAQTLGPWPRAGGADPYRRQLQDAPRRRPPEPPLHLHPRQFRFRGLRLDRGRRLHTPRRADAGERDDQPQPGARRRI